MMKTTLKLLLTGGTLCVTLIANAQTWSHGSNELRTGTSNTANGSLLFYNSTNSNTIGIQSGATSTSYTMTLPTAQGSAGDVLQNNGSGTLSWTSVSGIANVYEVSATISSSQILNLFSSPVTIVAAPGAGKYIEVISASAVMIYNSQPYADNTSLELRCAGSNVQAQAGEGYALVSTFSRNCLFVKHSYGVTPTKSQLVENTDLVLGVLMVNTTGGPTGGNSDIKIKVMYRIVTI
ncbi:MAG: hypothetical protein WBM13_07710 [Bacteroidia bacterium]